ncbi:MAG TPA: arginase, partial [Chitinophagaceae bacterium]|nr:arginase [Chitinophagaceae bacterium]
MSDALNIAEFLEPLNLGALSGDAGYREGQIGRAIAAYEEEFPDLEEADIVLLGCGEQRGAMQLHHSVAADAVRSAFYNLYYWHHDIRLADVGNIKIGKSLGDTYAALRIV